MFRPISISHSPNTKIQDILSALFLIFKPWQWKKGKALKELKRVFQEYFANDNIFFFNSGRSALLTILESLNLKKGDEILLQAYTCNAVANPIFWARLRPAYVRAAAGKQGYGGQAGLKPVYLDIEEENFNIDPSDLEKKITSRSQAIILQHTFGLPNDLEKILPIAKKYNLIVIEDCAHSLGAEYQNKKVGLFGDFSFFSFGRDKVISSVYGGAVIVNNQDYLNDFLKKYHSLQCPNYFWIFQQLLHPLLLAIILPLYNFFGLGKLLLVFFQKLKLLSLAVTKKEKQGQMPSYFPYCLPNGLAFLALEQFKRLEQFNIHRQKIANIYSQGLKETDFILPSFGPGDVQPLGQKHIFLRYTIKTEKAKEILLKAGKKGIILGNWYQEVIAPVGTDLTKMKYQVGSCQVAEKVAKLSLNLPTHINITEAKAKKIIKFLKDVSGGSMISISQINDKNQWENFVQSQEDYTFLHSWNWGEFNRLMGYKVWRLGLFEDNTLIGVALIIKITAKRGTFLFCPHGPIIKTQNSKLKTQNYKEKLKILINYLKKLAKEEKCSFIRISPILENNQENKKLFQNLGFRKAPIHMHAESSLLLDITKSKDELMRDMRKTTRYLIRRAQASGVKIEKEEPLKGQEFLRLQKEVAKRQHFVPFSEKHIGSEINAFTSDNQLIIFNAHYNHEIIASAIIILYGYRAFYYQAASSSKYEKIPATYLLVWQAILEAKDRGCRIFDFYGASPEGKTRHPFYGPTLFKKGFGGLRVDYLPAQDLILNFKYWFTFIIETIRRIKRGF